MYHLQKIYDLLALSSQRCSMVKTTTIMFIRDILENKEPYVSVQVNSEVQDNMEIMGK